MHLTYLKRYSFVKIDVVFFSDLAKIDQVRTSRYIYDTTIDVVIHRLCTACWAMMQYFIFHSCHGGMTTCYWAIEAKILSTNDERHLSSVFFLTLPKSFALFQEPLGSWLFNEVRMLVS